MQVLLLVLFGARYCSGRQLGVNRVVMCLVDRLLDGVGLQVRCGVCWAGEGCESCWGLGLLVQYTQELCALLPKLSSFSTPTDGLHRRLTYKVDGL